MDHKVMGTERVGNMARDSREVDRLVEGSVLDDKAVD